MIRYVKDYKFLSPMNVLERVRVNDTIFLSDGVGLSLRFGLFFRQ